MLARACLGGVLAALASIGGFAACGPPATSSPPIAPAVRAAKDAGIAAVPAPGSATPAGAATAAVHGARARAPRLVYPALACVPRRLPAKGPKPRTEPTMSCDAAVQRRAAWLAELDATGRLPRKVPEGAIEDGLERTLVSLGPPSNEEQLRLRASGPIGALLVDVDLDGSVRRVLSGAIEPLVVDYAPRYLAVGVLSPDIGGGHDWELTDIVSRDMRVIARVGGHARVGVGGVFLGNRGAAPEGEEQAAWARRELPPAERSVTLLDDAVSYVDVDAQVTRSFSPTWAEPRTPPALANVVAPKPGAVALAFRDTSACVGRWFDAKSKEGRSICDAHGKRSGARLLRAAASAGRKSASEIVDVDGGGAETVVARIAASPSAIELVGTADDQVAYVLDGKLHVEELGATEGRPKPRLLDSRLAIPCSRIGDGSCAIEDARLLSTGAALVHVGAGFEERLYVVTPAGWATTPMKSTQHEDVICIGRSVARGQDTTILVQCPGDEPEWHLRAVSKEGTITEGPASPAAVQLAELAAEPTSPLRLGGETVCAAGGLVYQGPACNDLVRPRKAEDR